MYTHPIKMKYMAICTGAVHGDYINYALNYAPSQSPSCNWLRSSWDDMAPRGHSQRTGFRGHEGSHSQRRHDLVFLLYLWHGTQRTNSRTSPLLHRYSQSTPRTRTRSPFSSGPVVMAEPLRRSVTGTVSVPVSRNVTASWAVSKRWTFWHCPD